MANTHVDVLIVGAGISGIGAAHYLKTKLPHKSFAILEARDTIGGTWDLFRYPGIRSDSDLHTFAYAFKPWTSDNAIADGQEILDYLEEAVAEDDLGSHIRFGHKVLSADFSAAEGRWTVTVERVDTGERFQLTCGLLFSAAGYYDYAAGYTPEFEGRETFAGTIVHPQMWPEDLDYTGKRVVVIGSGATAVTLIPAMADDAAHVTMLQRSPELRDDAPRQGSDRQRTAARAPRPHRVPDHASHEHRAAAVHLRAEHAPSQDRAPVDPLLDQAPAAGGIRGRHPLQPAVQPVGGAHVRRAQRGHVRGDPLRQSVDRHRPDRPLHRARHPARVRAGTRRPTSS